ncbi:hypothetical protein J2Z83_003357 [Virgibacillus natechei]|uniref:Uncharacterized protein n=1 Tax=Virgibacillus natechei TaxID=1216297 RepID=A0ABS4IJT2_9BACI|nr:hypothetical protein [Virgibacillus natechei]MBP1971218.1 hypothetical protein [Virgibacillus natechei]UZD11966.1 hypothetical protein OLD84_13570 [Virgibacillus natechei]
MTREMMEDLLEGFTKMTEDLQDIQANGNHMNDLILKTENKVKDVTINLNGLQQNLWKLDQKFNLVEGLMKTKVKRQIVKKAS